MIWNFTITTSSANNTGYRDDNLLNMDQLQTQEVGLAISFTVYTDHLLNTECV